MELSVDQLREICTIENTEITMHAAKRLAQRGITIKNIISCILDGIIIEQYPSDYPFPSCLVLGFPAHGDPLHVVVGSNLETLWIITAYYPSSEKWESDFMTRKEN